MPPRLAQARLLSREVPDGRVRHVAEALGQGVPRGCEPACTLLNHPRFGALRRVPVMSFGCPIRLAADPSAEELRTSPFASGSAALLGAAARGGGLQLTATGYLFRAVVVELVDCFS